MDELTENFNCLASIVGDLNTDELQNLSGLNFDSIDFDIIEGRLMQLYDQLVEELKSENEDIKKKAKYTLTFLIILFTYSNEK